MCVLSDYDKRSRINRIFRITILFNIGITVSDIVAYFVDGSTEPYAYYLVRLTNFLHYAFGALLLAAMTFYILAYLGTKTKVPRTLKDIVLSLCVLSMILTIVSHFTGLYYYIDENNVYHRGTAFWLSQVLPMVGMFFNIGVVLFYRKRFEKKFLFFFLSFMIFPMTALCLALVFYGITFINIASSLSLLLLYIGVQIDHTHNMMNRLKLMDNLLDMQGGYYDSLRSHFDEIKKARHDIRHHLSVIQSFVETGEDERLVEYIKDYSATLPDDFVFVYCDNYAINSVLLYYANMAKNEGIDVTINVELHDKFNISDTDLCIIFGNCIENALEACRKVEGEKFINIKSMITGNILTIVVDNSFNGELKRKGDGFLSSKKSGGGVGVPSVKTIVRKYNGDARFEAKGDIFQASLLLQLSVKKNWHKRA